MLTIRERAFVKEIVRLDDTNYVECSFTECVLQWYGGAFGLKGTVIKPGCKFELGGEAQRIADVLQRFGIIAPGAFGSPTTREPSSEN